MLNTLIQGDCLIEMKSIPDGSIDAIITDPPYGTTACRWDHVIPFDKMWEQLNRIIKPNGAIVLFGSEPFSSALRMSNIKQYKYDWIWDKKKAGNISSSGFQPLKTHEIISIFGNGKIIYYPQKVLLDKPQTRHLGKKSINKKTDSISINGKEIKYSDNYEPSKKLPVSIQTFSKDNYKSNIFHPTQKPVALIEYLIKTYTNEGETILDFTAGSGTTGVACKNTNRNYILIEKDEGYCDIIRKRLASNPSSI